MQLDKQIPLMDAFFHSLEGLIVSPKSALGRAIYYALGQKEYILNVYRDGRLDLTNNRAERSIMPFVIGRKNFLFANIPRGANASAILYSLVETAKETGVDSYRYFVFTLDEAAKLRAVGKTDKIAELTPNYFKISAKITETSLSEGRTADRFDAFIPSCPTFGVQFKRWLNGRWNGGSAAP